MGFLIFAFRKLSLRRQITQKQSRQMTLNMKLQQIQNQIGVMQQAKASSQNALQMMMQNTGSMNESLFQNQVAGYRLGYYQLEKKYQEEFAKSGNVETAQTQKIKNALNEYSTEATIQQQKAIFDFQSKQQALVATGQAFNSIFQSSDQADMNYLQQVNLQLQQEADINNSQIKLLSQELEEVSTAEDKSAKDSVAKFGYSG